MNYECTILSHIINILNENDFYKLEFHKLFNDYINVADV